MKKFTHRFQVTAPLEAVADFHRDTHALKKLTPFPLWVQIHKVEPLANDSRANFTIWAGPIPLHWEAVHTNVSDQGFTDTQIKGPYQYWVHNHQFISISPETTEVIDEVSARYGKGLFWGLVTRLMWLSMPFLFTYRSWRTRKALQGVS